MPQLNWELTISPPLKVNEISLVDQRKSPLLRLPAELRNHIYTLALGDATCTVQYYPRYHCGPPKPETYPYNCGYPGQRRHAPALLLTSRQIFAETRLLLVPATTFYFRFYADFEKWVEHTSTEFKNLVTSIEFHISSADLHAYDWGSPIGPAPWDPIEKPKLWNKEPLAFDMLPALQHVLIRLYVKRAPDEKPGLKEYWTELVELVQDLNGKGKPKITTEVEIRYHLEWDVVEGAYPDGKTEGKPKTTTEVETEV